jgi:hypothetical protein
MPDDQTAPGAPILWCSHCGQRHSSDDFCDPERLKQLAEWRAQLAAYRQATLKGGAGNPSTDKPSLRFWHGFGCGCCVGLFFGLIPTMMWVIYELPR